MVYIGHIKSHELKKYIPNRISQKYQYIEEILRETTEYFIVF